MADKTVSIKSASDKELDALLVRLRKEQEVQNIVMNIKRNSAPPATDPLRPYDYVPMFVSTEEPVDSLYHNEKVEAVLAHFGIPGMRWGFSRRKAAEANRAAGASRIKKAKDEDSEDHTKSRELKSKSTSKLSTKDLKDLTHRMQLEKQLRDLNRADITKGMDAVKAITTAGTTVATLYGLSKTPFGKDVISAVKTAMSSKAMKVAYKKAMGG
jgi:hypothetical protein